MPVKLKAILPKTPQQKILEKVVPFLRKVKDDTCYTQQELCKELGSNQCYIRNAGHIKELEPYIIKSKTCNYYTNPKVVREYERKRAS